jgi:hypothetical protein
VNDIDQKINRVNSLFTRVSSIPKPKEKKKKPANKNIKIDNITIDGNSGEDLNWEDFVKIETPEGGSEENTNSEKEKQEEQS